ncbi:MAG TPA: AMP-binding protein [Actinomycetota bacterium]|nr:AMP-binding protein [Actinomycetota bacterium]
MDEPVTIVWRPTQAYVERANVTRFMRANGIATEEELLRRSVEDVAWFWDAVVRDLGLEFSRPYERVLDTSAGIEWATWFGGGRVNLASNCVDRWAERTPDAVAVLWEGEEGSVRRVTYRELRETADRLAHGLSSLGVAERDTVGIFLPMSPEAVAAVMACAKLGAIFLPLFSGFAADAVAVRLNDAGAKALITADGFPRRGRPVAMKEVADDAAAQAPSVKHVVVCSRLGRDDAPWTPGRDVGWDELLEPQPARFETRELDPEHPLFIAYTSGTTGRPKGAVHVHGGFLVKIAEEVAYQTDVHPGEILYWFADLGWIMGPWEVVGATALGATVFLSDTAPDHPGPDRLWDMVERHRITHLGVSPTLIRALIPHGEEPVRRHDRSSLRILASTGEPWNPEPWRWFFEVVGEGRCPIVNLSGGTEVGACFLSPHPIAPLKPCTLRGPALGMDVAVVDVHGEPVGPGEVGELVCRQPWPGMTRGIWGDPSRYLDTYWRRFPGVWVHGDWASVDEDGFWFLHGRSDDTISLAGKRLGPAEVESVLAGHPAVAEAAAVGVPHPVKGEAVWCFAVTRPNADREGLEAELVDLVAEHLGKAFRPSRVVLVDELPRTRSAKIVRRAIRAAVSGEDPGDLSSLENPGALDAIRRATGRT